MNVSANHVLKLKRSELQTPVNGFLSACYDEFIGDETGQVADYIPELSKANPDHLGIALATIDGYVHEVGNTSIPFTIQSISKAYCFGLALELVGNDVIQKTIGVEASGDAFNSIRLQSDNRPFNPMVNAGAIACTGLIHEFNPGKAFDLIHQKLSEFAGRKLDVNESVYQSESLTGDRNRAIAWLLKNNGILRSDVDQVLDVYFKQCAIEVTARDLAIMGATLAANGMNPVTKKRVISGETTARTLSIMVNAGMYDFSGNWNYRIGLPAKSGVGGGIVASLPGQIGLGTYSPLLDEQGNSARGISICERLSSHYGLHVLAREGDVSGNIAADYTAENILSSRGRSPMELEILARETSYIRVLELTGELNFVACDFVSRTILDDDNSNYFIFDMARVTSFSNAAIDILSQLFDTLIGQDKRILISNLASDNDNSDMLLSNLEQKSQTAVAIYSAIDDALAWCEDQLIFQNGGFDGLNLVVDLKQQALLQGLNETQIELVKQRCELQKFSAGDKIIEDKTDGDSVYFLLSGMVSVVLPNNVYVANMSGGTCFGEFALITPGAPRSANIIADVACTCLSLTTSAFDELRDIDHVITENIMKNMALILSNHLKQANAKIDKLSGDR